MTVHNSSERSVILLVEDEQGLLIEVAKGLQTEGFQVLTATDRVTASQLFASNSVSVSAIILDRMLPDGDGLELLSQLRRNVPALPAIVISAKDTVSDRVVGLESGADDYLVKPFAFAELVARLRALLRRSSADDRAIVRTANLQIDLVQRQIVFRDQTLELTPRQCELLAYLARTPKQPVSRQTLLRDIWAEVPENDSNIVESSINQLRRKFARHGWPTLIRTVRGHGYCLEGEPCDDD